MNTMRSPSDNFDDEDLGEGEFVVDVFSHSNHQYDEPGATSNANHFHHSAQANNDGQYNAYQPVSSPAPELQYPLGVSGTPEDFRLGLRATHQAAFGFWAENASQMQAQQQQHLPSANAYTGSQLPAHMQQQQFRYSSGPGDPFVPSPTSRTADAGAHYAGPGAGAREGGVCKEHDFLTAPAASSLASPTSASSAGRSVAAQNIIPGLQKGKGKEREHAAMPALSSGVRTDHGHVSNGSSKPAKGQAAVSSSSASTARSHPSLQGTRDAKPNSSAANAKEPQYKTVKVDHPSSAPGEPPKKVKMHQCPVCDKLFPRPSGLDTHMNSHSGARRKRRFYSHFVILSSLLFNALSSAECTFAAPMSFHFFSFHKAGKVGCTSGYSTWYSQFLDLRYDHHFPFISSFSLISPHPSYPKGCAKHR